METIRRPARYSICSCCSVVREAASAPSRRCDVCWPSPGSRARASYPSWAITAWWKARPPEDGGITVMLSAEDNDQLTAVGAGTPMGRLIREYWIPALLSTELSMPNCAPVRVMLLGERLSPFATLSVGQAWSARHVLIAARRCFLPT